MSSQKNSTFLKNCWTGIIIFAAKKIPTKREKIGVWNAICDLGLDLEILIKLKFGNLVGPQKSTLFPKLSENS